MQIRRRIITSRPETPFEISLEEELLSWVGQLGQIINKGLNFEDNFNAKIITISDTGVADSENTVAHSLKRVPDGFLVLNINKGGIVYDSGTSWTATNIYLKCTTPNTIVKILIF